MIRVLKKVLLVCCIGLAACSDGRRQVDTSAGEALQDSIVAETDSIDVVAEEGDAMPVGADELFDDFFFNYASSRHQQLERTRFPLAVINIDKPLQVQKKDWKMETFFMKDDCYTLFFDSQEQMELMSDTTLMRVVVERFEISDNVVEQFVFSRESGRWMLHEVRLQELPQNPNAQFLKFYERFATDSLFQQESLADRIIFSGPDPDDDFATIDGVITPDFWEAFRPELPSGKLYNIVYGPQNPASIEKIFLLRGIDNGVEVELTFKLKRGRWKLTKLMM